MVKTNTETEVLKTEQHYKVKIAGNAVILSTDIKLEDLNKLNKRYPEALCLYQMEQDEIIELFRVLPTNTTSNISKYGIVFAEQDTNGNARATILLPENVENKKEYLKEEFGMALIYLNKILIKAKDYAQELNEMFKELDEVIEEI